MGKSVQRVGDANAAGGVITGPGSPSVRMNGRAISLHGDSVSAHPCCGRRGCPPIHCYATTVASSTTVRANGINIVLTGDVDTCGHPRVGGTADVGIT